MADPGRGQGARVTMLLLYPEFPGDFNVSLDPKAPYQLRPTDTLSTSIGCTDETTKQ